MLEKERHIVCDIAAQLVVISRIDLCGFGECQGGCQLCRKGGFPLVEEDRVVRCDDLNDRYDKILALGRAIKEGDLASGSKKKEKKG